MLTPGTLLGERYEIIEKIGAGGMSIVYKAKDNRLQRFVAIKELREEFVQDEEFVNKFRKEALSAARLSHPNIVGIYDVVNDHDMHYIVMEYVEGQTLKQIIAEKGPFDSKTVLELGIQMVSALKHAHQKRIIHRDIKPQNILMTHDGMLKVTDFGIAKAVDSSTIVATGNAIGSVHYFSPEQAKGKYVNESSDLYSCGIVLFELATKKLPFEADSHVSIALKHINEEFPKPSSINPCIPENLEKIILKATAKNQADRYQNADEMLHDMRGVLQNPNYVVQTESFTEKTILLSAEETKLLRESEKETPKEISKEAAKESASANPVSQETNIYEQEVGFSEKDDEDEGEVSTFYRVVASLGGVLVTLALVVVISLAAVLWLPSLTKGKTYSVPNVVDMTLEEAQNAIRKSNLKYQVEHFQTTEEENGTVVDQDPAGGTVVKKNSIVTIRVAINESGEAAPDTDEKEISVPDFENKDSADVMNQIVELGLKVGKTTFEYSERIESGRVISQTPSAGTMAVTNDTVDLVISKGPEKEESVSVPNLIGSTVDEAEEALNRLGLKLGKQKEEYSDTEAGYIIRQNLSVGSSADPGTKVDVTVSKGPKEPEPVEKPEESQPPASEIPSESPVPEEPAEPEMDVPTTQSYTVNLPNGSEVKESYHVVVKLTLEDGTTSLFDENVAYENFPKTISFTGIGAGKLDVLIDGSGYQDSIKFQ